MIASLRGLVVLAVIAAALAIAVVVDRARSTGPVDRALVHLDVAKVQRLAWPDLVATRTGATWKSAGNITLDAAAIGDVLRTLEAAHWHRRGGTPGPVRTTLEVDRTTIGIAGVLPGSDQTWLVVDGTPLLVDSWVARALAPGALALHVRNPFASASRSDQLWVHAGLAEVNVSGHPRRQAADGTFANVDAIHALEQALADVEVVALAAPPLPGTPAVPPDLVALAKVRESVGGPCGQRAELVAVHGTYGDECVTTAAWQRVGDAARAAEHAIELRPFLGVPARVTLADGTAVDLHDDAAAPLLHALTTPARSIARSAPPAEITHLTIANRDGTTLELRVRPHDLVERVADRAVLQLAHADWLALQAPASAYVDPTRWAEDPTAVESIGVAGVSYHRGAVLGEWTPAAPLAPAALNALATALAHVQARDSAPAPTAHIFTVTLAPPVGAHVTHALELGARCAGRIDGKPVTFEPATCQALERAVH